MGCHLETATAHWRKKISFMCRIQLVNKGGEKGLQQRTAPSKEEDCYAENQTP